VPEEGGPLTQVDRESFNADCDDSCPRHNRPPHGMPGPARASPPTTTTRRPTSFKAAGSITSRRHGGGARQLAAAGDH